MNKLAAIYARVSSDRQREDKTIASQTTSLREYAQVQGYTVPSEWVFEDEGYSGATLARPGLERLRDLAAEGQVQAVLVYGPDRLSRKYAYQVLLLEEFSRHGVETVFLQGVSAQTPEERLLVQFQGMIAEYERAQIAERSRILERHNEFIRGASASTVHLAHLHVEVLVLVDDFLDLQNLAADIHRDLSREVTIRDCGGDG